MGANKSIEIPNEKEIWDVINTSAPGNYIIFRQRLTRKSFYSQNQSFPLKWRKPLKFEPKKVALPKKKAWLAIGYELSKATYSYMFDWEFAIWRLRKYYTRRKFPCSRIFKVRDNVNKISFFYLIVGGKTNEPLIKNLNAMAFRFWSMNYAKA